MATCERRGKGWRVRWRSLDGSARSRACPDAATAKRLAREVERAHALGADWTPDPGPAADIPAILTAYLVDQQRLVAPSTLKGRQLALNAFAGWLAERHPDRHLAPALLTRDNLAAWHASVVAGGCKRSSANDYLRRVYGALVWAHDSDAYGAVVPRPRRPATPEPEPPPRTSAPTWGDMDAAIDAARGRGLEWYARLMTVARYTGLRSGQVLRLEWPDVDLEAHTLTVRSELGKTRQERRGRKVPLSPHLCAELAGWGRREGLLVARESVRPAVPVLHAIWIDAGVERERWRSPLHCFRKGFVSGLAAAGVAERVVRILVGHAQGVTGDVYTDAEALWPALVEAVATVPERGSRPRIAFAPRVRSVSSGGE